MNVMKKFIVGILSLAAFQISPFVQANQVWKITEGPDKEWAGTFIKVKGNMPEKYDAVMYNQNNEKLTYHIYSYRIGNLLFLVRKDSSDSNNCIYTANITKNTKIDGQGYCDNGGKPYIQGIIV